MALLFSRIPSVHLRRVAILAGAGFLSMTPGQSGAEPRAGEGFPITPGMVEIPFSTMRPVADPNMGGLFSKSRAILGGIPSQLDLIMALQNPSPAAPSLALSAPIVRPLTPAGNVGVRPISDTGTIGAALDAGFVNRGIPMVNALGVDGIPPSTPLSRPASIPRPTDAPDVFGSVAMLVRHTALDAKWRSVGHAALSRGPWSGLIRTASSMQVKDRVAAVNRWVNARISFASDGSARGEGDEWAGAARSLRSGRGDCEDYAIAKLQILRTMGFSEDDLYLVIARDLVRRADHAVLAVRIEGALVILDSEINALLDGKAAQDYRPIVSFSGTRSWIHGYRLEEPALTLASQPTPRPIQLASR